MIGGPLMAGVYLGLAFCPPSYGWLIFWCLAQTVMQCFIGAAARGLVASVAKWHGMMGRIGSMTVVTGSLIRVVSNSGGGYIDEKFGHIAPFVASAIFCLPTLLLAFWRPKAVFEVEDNLEVPAIPQRVWESIKQLARHKAIYLPALAAFLWAFAPGWGTPLLFFFTKDRHLSESVYGNAISLIGLGTLLTSLSYSWLCLKVPFRWLAYGGTVGGVLGAALFLLAHDAPTAYLFSFLAGASCGIPVGAYADLVIRSCPKEYEGAAFMLFASAGFFAGDVSDLFGSWLYEKGCFGLALLATAITTGSIIIVLLFVPRSVTEVREGQPIMEDLDLASSAA